MPHPQRRRDFSVSYDDSLVPDDAPSQNRHDGLDQERRFAKRRRIEENAKRYLNNGTLQIQSASLRGPLPFGWTNPWRPKAVGSDRPPSKSNSTVARPRAVEETRQKPECPQRLQVSAQKVRLPKPEARATRKADLIKRGAQTRQSKPIAREVKQLDLVRGDTPMDGLHIPKEPECPRDAIQSWLRRVSFSSCAGPEPNNPETPSKPSATLDKCTFVENEMVSNHAIAAPASPSRGFHAVAGFTAINHPPREVMQEDRAQEDTSPSRASRCSKTSLRDQRRILDAAEKCLSPHRFKVPPKPIAKPVTVNQRLGQDPINRPRPAWTLSARNQPRNQEVKNVSRNKQKADFAGSLPLVPASEQPSDVGDPKHLSSNITDLRTRLESSDTDLQSSIPNGEPTCTKVTDSVPTDLVTPSAPAEPMNEVEDIGSRPGQSYPERQDSKAYSSLSCDLNTQLDQPYAQRNITEEPCPPIKSFGVSTSQPYRDQSSPTDLNYRVSSFRQIRSPVAGADDRMNSGNLAIRQDLIANFRTAAFMKITAPNKAKSTNTAKRASFVAWPVSKPFIGSDENKDPDESVDAQNATNHPSQASASSPSSQPILRKRTSLKHLPSLAQTNSQPMSTLTPYPSVTLLPSASFAFAAESGTVMPLEYHMGQRMFRSTDFASTDSFDFEDLDVEASLDDASAFLNVDMS